MYSRRTAPLVLPNRVALAYVIATASIAIALQPQIDAAIWKAIDEGTKACGADTDKYSYRDICARPLLQRETDAPVQDGLYLFEAPKIWKVFGVAARTHEKHLPILDSVMAMLLGPAGLPTTGCLWLIEADRHGGRGVTCGRFSFCACSLHEECRSKTVETVMVDDRSNDLKGGSTYRYPFTRNSWTLQELRLACHPTGMRHILLGLPDIMKPKKKGDDVEAARRAGCSSLLPRCRPLVCGVGAGL